MSKTIPILFHPFKNIKYPKFIKSYYQIGSISPRTYMLLNYWKLSLNLRMIRPLLPYKRTTIMNEGKNSFENQLIFLAKFQFDLSFLTLSSSSSKLRTCSGLFQSKSKYFLSINSMFIVGNCKI